MHHKAVLEAHALHACSRVKTECLTAVNVLSVP
jgi:hypothetical protein